MPNPILESLRAELSAQNAQAFLIPKSDPHRWETTEDADNMLKHLSHFTGSTGFGVVSLENAAVFVDGRYTLQAENEVNQKYFELAPYSFSAISKWVQENTSDNGTVLYDPYMLSEAEKNHFESDFAKLGRKFLATASNPVTKNWTNRPEHLTPQVILFEQSVGMSRCQKIEEVIETLDKLNVDMIFMSCPELICWFLNIRAPQRPYSPAVSSYLLVEKSGHSTLFINPDLVDETVAKALAQENCTIADYKTAFDHLSKRCVKKTVLLDPQELPAHAFTVVEEGNGHISSQQNPCVMMRACKAPIEIQAVQAAHNDDGAACCDFLAWLYGLSDLEKYTENDLAQKLLGYRQKIQDFQGVSFDSIVGSGPNGAIVHYRPDEEKSRHCNASEILLIDSGGQYLRGTTDVTRTVLVSQKPTKVQQEHFTRVLKGHIALATAIFPSGTTGSQLDVLARQFLWNVGLDYAHGTGHGVGHFLSVHEGPQRISNAPNTVPLLPGMILSNEPGYYKKDHYGIRIENLVVVEPRPLPGQEQSMYGFKTITLIPIERALIDISLLTSDEIRWIDSYHQRVYETLENLVMPETKPWLAEQTKKL